MNIGPHNDLSGLETTMMYFLEVDSEKHVLSEAGLFNHP